MNPLIWPHEYIDVTTWEHKWELQKINTFESDNYTDNVCVMAKETWLGFSYNPKIPSFFRKLVMALFDAQFVYKEE